MFFIVLALYIDTLNWKLNDYGGYSHEFQQ